MPTYDLTTTEGFCALLNRFVDAHPVWRRQSDAQAQARGQPGTIWLNDEGMIAFFTWMRYQGWIPREAAEALVAKVRQPRGEQDQDQREELTDA
jgi:hypothetical protein